jgi:hypothetical protein
VLTQLIPKANDDVNVDDFNVGKFIQHANHFLGKGDGSIPTRDLSLEKEHPMELRFVTPEQSQEGLCIEIGKHKLPIQSERQISQIPSCMVHTISYQATCVQPLFHTVRVGGNMR